MNTDLSKQSPADLRKWENTNENAAQQMANFGNKKDKDSVHSNEDSVLNCND